MVDNKYFKAICVLFLGIIAVYLDPIVRQKTLVIDETVNIIFQYITRMGDAIIGIPLVLLVIAIAYYKHQSSRSTLMNGLLRAVVTMLIGTVVINLGKSLIGRARPKLFTEYGAYHFKPLNFVWDYHYTSFPSGHTTTWGLLALSCAVIFPRYKWLWIFSALLVGLSRIILGAHHVSDVFFSLLLSYGIVYYCQYMMPFVSVDTLKKRN